MNTVPDVSPVRGVVLRRVAAVLVGCAVFAIVVQTWLIEGLFTQVHVASNSMTPALLGPHCDVQCADCGCRFAWDAENFSTDKRAICSNCGFAENDLTDLATLPGTRLWIDRTALWRDSLRRWDVVVYRCPDQPDEYCVKRLVGLPGERVVISHGDIFINGQLAERSIDQIRAMATLVHDSRLTARTQDPSQPHARHPQWRSPTPDSHWQAQPDGFAYSINASALPAVTAADTRQNAATTAQVDWLEFEYRKQRFTGRPLFDRVCEFDAQLGTAGQLCFRSTLRGEAFVLRIDLATGAGELQRDGETVTTVQLDTPGRELAQHWTIAHADRAWRLFINGRVVVEHSYDPRYRLGGMQSAPLALGVQGPAQVEITSLQVWQDVSYTPWPGRELDWQPREFQLKNDEYFVLGDNSEVSDDSRLGRDGAPITASLIRGKAIFLRRDASTH